VLYLLFQLKSHSYMYESTPQHVIDEESYPGVLADLLNSSTSSDTSSSSSDSDSTSGSYRTANRIKKLMRRRRKSSVSSVEIPSLPSKPTRSSSVITNSDRPSPIEVSENRNGIQLGAIASSNEADTDGEHDLRHTRSAGGPAITYRDFEAERVASVENVDSIEQDDESKDKQKKHKKKRGFRRHHRKHKRDEQRAEPSVTVSASTPQSTIPHAPLESVAQTNTPQIGFAEDTNATGPGGSKRAPGMARIPRPTLNKMLGATVFSSTYAAQSGPAIAQKPVVVRAPYGLRRTSSLPDRLNIIRIQSQRPTDQLTRVTPDSSASKAITSGKGEEPKKHMSRTSAILLLLVSTALVAVCANFLVGSIDYLVNNSSVTQTFIGLIVLPIVGNAAEHVTAVTVASKNKMDLAIGVAVGSSIQVCHHCPRLSVSAPPPANIFLPLFLLLYLHDHHTLANLHPPKDCSLRHPHRRPPRLDPATQHEPVLFALRDRLALRLCLHRQFPRPRRPLKLLGGRPALCRIHHHRCGCFLLPEL